MDDFAERKRVNSEHAVSRTTIHGWPAVLFGMVFLLAGTAIILVSADVIQADPSSFHAPRWVVGCAGGIFAISGLWVSLHGADGVWAARRRRRMARLRPEEPWLADHAWSSRGVRSRNTGSFLSHAFGLGFIAFFLVPFHWWALSPAGGWFVKIIVGFFDLIMLLVVGQIVRRAIAQLRFGRPELRFGAFPFHPGELLDAELVCPRGIGRFDRLELTLRYIVERYVETGTGDDRRTDVVCESFHTDTVKIEEPGSHGAADRMPVTFLLPDDAEPCVLAERPARFWELQVTATTSGIDFDHRFLVPVYRRPSRNSGTPAAMTTTASPASMPA